MLRILSLTFFTICAAPLLAQSTGLSFGALNIDPLAAVEMSADGLSVDQTSGNAVFEGNVKIGQGDLRLAADRVVVVYASSGGIDSLTASGNVTFITATEAAEAQSAIYSLANQNVILSGDVLLTQGQNALLADTMRVDLRTGNAVLEGNVKTILQPSAN